MKAKLVVPFQVEVGSRNSGEGKHQFGFFLGLLGKNLIFFNYVSVRSNKKLISRQLRNDRPELQIYDRYVTCLLREFEKTMEKFHAGFGEPRRKADGKIIGP